MEAAYVFGNVGNLTNQLGRGWSVEDQYAWAIGDESELNLPLPNDDAAYVVRFTVHPLTYPDLRPSQRLTVLAAGNRLADVILSERGIVEVRLPATLTQGQASIALTLLHPDSVRPSDARKIDDTRWLSLCFHSASLVRLDPSGEIGTSAAARPTERSVAQSIVAGNYTGLQVARIFHGLPALRDRLAVQYVDLSQRVLAPAPSQAVANAQICWIQSDVGLDDARTALRARLPGSCRVLTVPTPHCHALWPFQGPDPRLVCDPTRYPQGRYPVTDRIAAGLAQYNITNDVLLMIYESMVEKEMPDLDAMLRADIASWHALDARADIKLADRLVSQFCDQRMFIAPTIPGSALLRELVIGLLESPPMRAIIDPASVMPEVDRLMEGYVGRREEVPIHPRVARHFQLGWWREDLVYRWSNNRYGFRDYVIDYIRWAPWRP